MNVRARSAYCWRARRAEYGHSRDDVIGEKSTEAQGDVKEEEIIQRLEERALNGGKKHFCSFFEEGDWLSIQL